MRKALVLLFVLFFMLSGIGGSIALANPGSVASDINIPVQQPNLSVGLSGIALDSQHETTNLVGAPEVFGFPRLGIPPIEVAMASDTEPPEIGADCPIGWFPCQGGEMLCYGVGCPSFRCGTCDCSVAGGAPGCASCEGWTWNGTWASRCMCRSSTGVLLIDAFCPGACVYVYQKNR